MLTTFGCRIRKGKFEYTTKTKLVYKHKLQSNDAKDSEAIALAMGKMEGLQGNKENEEVTFGAPYHLKNLAIQPKQPLQTKTLTFCIL